MPTTIKGFDSAKPHLKVVPLTPKPRRRAEERWGKAVMARGFTVLPTMIFWAQARLGLTPDEFNVVLQLAAHWWDAGENPRPAKDTIAERIGNRILCRPRIRSEEH